MKLISLAITTTGLLCFALPGFADICGTTPGNIVANCGFENGIYSSTIGASTNNSVPIDWTPNAGYDLEPSFNNVTSFSNSGSAGLSIGNYDYQPVPSLSQTLTDISSAAYSGSLFVAYGGGVGGDSGAFFDVLINGATVLALDDTATYPYARYTFNFTGTGSDVLTIEGNTNPSEWYADDIVVTTAATPEPQFGFLMAGVMLGFAFFVRRHART
jgi:hypothetical protein